ncbi:MAG: prolyl oligopeptidase family serine peptidase [Xanthomonadales bacterium]|nr:prolyl oligopeptidase family serine peptidase [Xanthomonadales bacterium]
MLTGVMLTQRPELWGGVVIQVPLLDMRRYHRLLAGASWMAEYGNPDDPAEWAFIGRYSPYQNLRPEVRYPPVLVTTSTRDDRVHPGHARKFVARLLEYGKDVTYYENTEGGHGGAADNPQRALMEALVYAWLAEVLGCRGVASRPRRSGGAPWRRASPRRYTCGFLRPARVESDDEHAIAVPDRSPAVRGCRLSAGPERRR